MGKKIKINKKTKNVDYIDPYKEVNLLNIDEKYIKDKIKKIQEQNKKKLKEAKKLEEQKKLEKEKIIEEEKNFEKTDDEIFSSEEIKIDSNKEYYLEDDFFERNTKEATKDEPVSQERYKCEEHFSIFNTSILSDDEGKKLIESIINNNNCDENIF